MWHRSFLHCVEEAKERGLCLYGAGYWGSVAYDLFEKFGVTPLCYCDDDTSKKNTKYRGVPVYSLEDAAKKYPNAEYIVCIDETKRTGNYDRWKQCRMLERLKECGVHDSNSEFRIIYYLFLLDIDKTDVDNMNGIDGKEEPDMIWADDIKNIVLFNNMSNSGAYYLEQLVDGHSNILCLPYCESLEKVYENRLQYLEGVELLVEMTAQMLGYFHSQFEDLECVGQHRYQGFCTDENGNFIKDILIDPKEFIRYLKVLFGGNMKLKSYGHMLKLYFAAYNNCLGRKNNHAGYWMFYHMHLPNYDVESMYANLNPSEFERVENLIIIREPVQHLYSWIRRLVIHEKNNTAVRRTTLADILKSELGVMLEKRKGVENVRAIKFEDVKYHTKETMANFCKWLQIPYEDLLLSTTVNGFKIYFPANTPSGIKYITGNDTSSVANTQFSEILTLWDEARLNMLYAKAKQAFGYENSVPSFTKFERDIFLKMLEEPFKFSKIVQDCLEEFGSRSETYDVNEFVKDIFIEYIEDYREDKTYYDYIKPL